MDGKQGADGGIVRQAIVLQLQQGDGHGRLPIMGVEHVGEEADVGHAVQHRLGEESKPLRLVVAEVAVDIAAVEVVLIIHKIIGYPIQLQGLDAAILAAPAQGDGEVADMGHAALKFLRDGGKLGQDDPDVRAQGFELLGQGADHIRQAAGFNKGYALAGSDQNPQGRGSWLFKCRILFHNLGILHDFFRLFRLFRRLKGLRLRGFFLGDRLSRLRGGGGG